MGATTSTFTSFRDGPTRPAMCRGTLWMIGLVPNESASTLLLLSSSLWFVLDRLSLAVPAVAAVLRSTDVAHWGRAVRVASCPATGEVGQSSPPERQGYGNARSATHQLRIPSGNPVPKFDRWPGGISQWFESGTPRARLTE
jgi:hypothetical protein